MKNRCNSCVEVKVNENRSENERNSAKWWDHIDKEIKKKYKFKDRDEIRCRVSQISNVEKGKRKETKKISQFIPQEACHINFV